MLRAARSWRVAPSVFLGQRSGAVYERDVSGRVVRIVDWTLSDTELALALEGYEAGLCPGCQHPLAETCKPEHKDAYRPDPPIRCHYCTAEASTSETAEKQHERSAGLLFTFSLDPDVVELNRQPIPPLPPELQ